MLKCFQDKLVELHEQVLRGFNVVYVYFSAGACRLSNKDKTKTVDDMIEAIGDTLKYAPYRQQNKKVSHKLILAFIEIKFCKS